MTLLYFLLFRQKMNNFNTINALHKYRKVDCPLPAVPPSPSKSAIVSNSANMTAWTSGMPRSQPQTPVKPNSTQFNPSLYLSTSPNKEFTGKFSLPDKPMLPYHSKWSFNRGLP